ncbi:SsrA-binding protein SmpB [Blastopirellula retiformator]|uniref:SsrA-binding protein n=1 Tax=Blastopirellula retiformator TaxID=2527970 RepID=A0A5C5V4P2_9BACT|nr:SsrA-binding protein SmpB [Blastopirellula retiformator]TWT33030.1 SsrA-binding protein [Blastopirellula retiformator]
MAKKKDSKEDDKKKLERPIGENRKARHDYEIIDTLECGIQLVGSEVKSLRDGKLSLSESFARVLRGEVFLVNCEIPEYSNTSMFLNHEPKRPRKLLLHKTEIAKFAGKSEDRGLSLVPLKMYFKQGRVKVLLGVGRGRKQHDKRDKLKSQDAKRDMARAMRNRG